MPRTTLWRLESSFNKIDRVGVPPPGINNDNGDQNVPPPENQESESERGDSIPELDDEVIVDSIGSAHEEFGSSEENNTDSASQTNSDTGVALQSRDSHLVRSIIHTSAKPSSRQTNVSNMENTINDESATSDQDIETESTTGDPMSELDQIIESSIAEATNSGNSFTLSAYESSTISEVDISEEESTTGDSMSELDQIIDSSIAEETNSGNSSTHESSTISEVDISEEESYLNSNSRSYSEDGDSDSTHTDVSGESYADLDQIIENIRLTALTEAGEDLSDIFPTPLSQDEENQEEWNQDVEEINQADQEEINEENQEETNQEDQEENANQREGPYSSEAYKTLKRKLKGELKIIPQQTPKISLGEFLLNSLTLVNHFKLNFSNFEGIMKLVNTLFKERIVPDTRYLLDKLFVSLPGMHYHFVCAFCMDYLGEFDHSVVSQIACDSCEKVTVISDLNKCSFFVTFDLPQQIEVLLSNRDIFQSLKNPFDLRNNVRPNVMEDVYDGELYQKFIRSLKPGDNCRHISLCFGVDGASFYTSSNCEIWPVFCSILELPVNIRSHNLLLAALWFGKGHAPLDVFLIPVVKHLQLLSKHGFNVDLHGESIFIKCHCICCCADAPARAGVQGIHQHGGSFSCPWCLHPSEHRLYKILDYPPEKRTKQQIIDDGAAALVLDSGDLSVRGVTGLSPVLLIPTMDIVDGMILEYFHAAAHGICKQFLKAWLGEDGANKDIPYYIGSPNNEENLDRRLRLVRLPVEARRPARLVSEIGSWSGRDFENFLLYGGVALIDILPQRYLRHWFMFVQAMHLLLQDRVTDYQLTSAKDILRNFANLASVLYPEHHQTYNMHIISFHLADNCRNWGPAWAINGYCFEDGNKVLKNKIHANLGVASQVCRALSHAKSLEILRSAVETPSSEKFKADIEKKTVNSCVVIDNDKYFGSQKKFTPSQEELFMLTERGIFVDSFVSVSKLIHNGCVYTTSNVLSKITNNSVAMLSNNTILLIDKIIISEELSVGLIIGHKMRCSTYHPIPRVDPNEAFLKIVSSTHNESSIISPNDLKTVCARLILPHGDFVIKVPNIYNTC